MAHLLSLAFGQAQQNDTEVDQSVLEHAAHLGMDTNVDYQHMWIAKESLLAPLPDGWSLLQTDEGHAYYWHEASQQSQWEHPKDEYYRNLYRQHKAEEAILTSRSVDPGFRDEPCIAAQLSARGPSPAMQFLDLQNQSQYEVAPAQSPSVPMLNLAPNSHLGNPPGWEAHPHELILQSARYEGEIATLKEQLEIARDYRSPIPSPARGSLVPSPKFSETQKALSPKRSWADPAKPAPYSSELMSDDEDASVATTSLPLSEDVHVLHDRCERLTTLKRQLEVQNKELQDQLLEALRRATKTEKDLEAALAATLTDDSDKVDKLRQELEDAIERAEEAEKQLAAAKRATKMLADEKDFDLEDENEMEHVREHRSRSSRKGSSPKNNLTLDMDMIPTVTTRQALSPIRSPADTESAINKIREKARKKIDNLKKKITDLKALNKSLKAQITTLEDQLEEADAEKQELTNEVVKARQEIKEARLDRTVAREEIAQLRAINALVKESEDEIDRTSIGDIMDKARETLGLTEAAQALRDAKDAKEAAVTSEKTAPPSRPEPVHEQAEPEPKTFDPDEAHKELQGKPDLRIGVPPTPKMGDHGPLSLTPTPLTKRKDGWEGLLEEIDGALKSCFFCRRSPTNSDLNGGYDNILNEQIWVANEEQLGRMLEQLVVVIEKYIQRCPELNEKGVHIGKGGGQDKEALEDLKAAFDRLQETHKGSLESNANLEREKADALRDLESAQKRLEELHKQLEDTEDSNGQSTAALNALRSERENLEQELDAIKTDHAGKIRDLEQQLAEARDDKDRTTRELEESKGEGEDKTRQIEHLRKAVEDHEAICTKLRSDKDDRTKKCKKLEDKLSRAKTSIAEFKEREEQAVKMFEELEHEMDSVKDQTKRAKKDAAEKSKTIRDLESRNEKLSGELQTQIAQLRDVLNKQKELTERILELQGNIRVFARVRPLSEQERMEQDSAGEVLTRDGRSIRPEDAIRYMDEDKFNFHGTSFEFDKIFSPTSTQEQVFGEVEHAVAKALDGFRVCIFAYGQTGSGKTFTMEGPASNRGVNFRALKHLFDLAPVVGEEDEISFKVSMLEVYNEKIRDLLAPPGTPGSDDLSVRVLGGGSSGGSKRRGAKKGVFVEGLLECEVNNVDEVEEIMSLGGEHRSTASNNVNEHSSRSHLVLQVKVLRRGSQHGLLSLIDLAGSERLKNTSAQGQRLKEAQNINKSLSALGDVIAALGSSQGHVPYRNSKLTFLLQDSLGPSSKVLMFVNINPAFNSAGESTCSLNFASRCRSVQLGPARRVGGH